MHIKLLLLITLISSLVSVLQGFSAAPTFTSSVTSVKTGEQISVSDFLTSNNNNEGGGGKYTMLVFGTYAADFNAIEYGQRLRYYLPQLKDLGVNKIGFLLNASPDAAKALIDEVDLNLKDFELLIDENGEAGREFGVGTGWRPDDTNMSPYVKLFGMLFGLGAWATLPAVIGGYIGNPITPQPWIQDAMAVGIQKGRWPDNALELDEESFQVKVNKFQELPLVGSWQRRPLELATLRLQNMLDISIKKWDLLAPSEGALKSGVLTQLGGCLIINNNASSLNDHEIVYDWKDPGICAVANFENIIRRLNQKNNGS